MIQPVAMTTLLLLVVASGVAMALAGWVLKPIHVITMGLSRLGRGEHDVTVDLPPGDDSERRGRSFNAISAQLATRESSVPAYPTLESIVAHLDAPKLMVPASLPLLSADPTLLRHALMNLVLNACQAMPSGGRLRISGRAAQISN